METERIKLAEAMGWRPGWAAGWRTKDQGLPPDIWSPPGTEYNSCWHQAHELPDPFADVNDDFEVLVWMRRGETETPEWRRFKDTMLEWATSHSWNYRVGDWARAALQALHERGTT